jgi:ribosomal silencing factor RsfS
MATLKQFEANRRNAQKSTGPKTPEGKSAVSMNALRHGLRARTVVLPGEDPTEFHQLCDDLQAEWTPQSRTEQFYVEQMAVSQWKLTRMEVVEVNIFKDDETKSRLSRLDQLWQAECRLERSYSRAQRELQRLQKSRPHPDPQPEEPAPAQEPQSAATAEVGQAVLPVQSTVSSEIRNPKSMRFRHLKSEIRHPKSTGATDIFDFLPPLLT